MSLTSAIKLLHLNNLVRFLHTPFSIFLLFQMSQGPFVSDISLRLIINSRIVSHRLYILLNCIIHIVSFPSEIESFSYIQCLLS